MKLRPEEITSILKERIEHFDVQTDLSDRKSTRLNSSHIL